MEMNTITPSNKSLTDYPSSNTFSTSKINAIYDAVFRGSTEQPGFYFQDFGKQIDSKTFRQLMVELKSGLSRICELRSDKQLNYQWMGRFNHQHSSGFHRDSAEAHSFLMLGYEPTNVDSKVFVADYSKLIESHNVSLEAYFEGTQDINTANNNHPISPFVTELAPFPKDHYRLLLVNNSKSFEEKTYGLFHRGEVAHKIDGEDRIINSLMLHMCDKSVEEQFDSSAIMDFIHTEKVDR
ncbi:MAG: hypothetical protein AAFX87_16745 [Bacteroidota bacterium]